MWQCLVAQYIAGQTSTYVLYTLKLGNKDIRQAIDKTVTVVESTCDKRFCCEISWYVWYYKDGIVKPVKQRATDISDISNMKTITIDNLTKFKCKQSTAPLMKGVCNATL